jgi:predicted ArsR family transcriptional regulator
MMTDQQSSTAAKVPAKPGAIKTGARTKSEDLRKLLSRRNGATVAQVQKQMGWQPHTVRAAISRLRTAGVSVELDRSGKLARYRLLPGAVE